MKMDLEFKDQNLKYKLKSELMTHKIDDIGTLLKKNKNNREKKLPQKNIQPIKCKIIFDRDVNTTLFLLS
jgi:hypothetical protein